MRGIKVTKNTAGEGLAIEFFLKELIEAMEERYENIISKPFISQAKAYKIFKRGNVERWVKSKKATTYHRPNGTVEYKMVELLRAAENQQEYLYQ